MTTKEAKKELHKYASIQKATILSRFFKAGPGEYGEGDIFIGVKVPETRKVAKIFADLSITETLELLCSPLHEERLLALLILMQKYDKGAPRTKENIVKIYLRNASYVNNWDLVDLSAHKILGDWLLCRKQEDKGQEKRTAACPPAHLPACPSQSRKILYKLADSASLWERRIAIVATYAFIRKNDFTDTLHIAKVLLNDCEDLLHKATGWMLREVGKRDIKILEDFLKKNYKGMPRTMLRYAIERFPKKKRRMYLDGSL